MSSNQIRGCRTSALQLMTTCPRSLQLVYGEGAVGANHPTAIFGSMLHDMLEEYGAHCLGNGYELDFDFIDERKYDYVVKVAPDWRKEGLMIIEAFKNTINFSEGLAADVAEVETRFFLDKNFEICTKDDDWTYTSAIDYHHVSGNFAFVEDYKSIRSVYSEEELKRNLQKDYYPLLIFLRYPEVEEITFRFNYIRYGTTSREFNYTREEDFERLLGCLKADVKRYYELVQSKDKLPAYPTGFCALCGVSGLCDEFKNAMQEVVRFNDLAGAEKAARALRVSYLLGEQLKKNLASWTSVHGNFTVDGGDEVGHKVKQKRVVDNKRGLLKALEKAGCPPGAVYDVISINVKEVEKLCRGYGVQLDQYVKARTVSEFEGMA